LPHEAIEHRGVADHAQAPESIKNDLERGLPSLCSETDAAFQPQSAAACILNLERDPCHQLDW
jgi:hypothetical protein